MRATDARSGIAPLPQQIVITTDQCAPRNLVGVGLVEFLNRVVHVEQHAALTIIAHQTLYPEKQAVRTPRVTGVT